MTIVNADGSRRTLLRREAAPAPWLGPRLTN
jgi:hypothetical protein